MIKLAIFDFDGVIADALDLAVETINRMLADEGHSKRISKRDVREKGLKGLVKELKIPAYKVPFYIHRSRGIVNRKIDSVKIFPGIKDALIKLKENCRLAIVTSNSEDNLDKVLKNNGMEELFDFAIAGVGVFGKASKLRKAVKMTGVRKDEAVCVGDEVRDIEAARKAGLRIIAVSWGFNSEKLLAENKPDYIARKPGELTSLIKNIL